MVPAVSFSEVTGSLVSGAGLPGGVSDTCDTFSPSSAGNGSNLESNVHALKRTVVERRMSNLIEEQLMVVLREFVSQDIFVWKCLVCQQVFDN